jgi:hypothetical protein
LIDYLDGRGDCLDDKGNERSDLFYAPFLQRQVVVVDPELAHEEEGSAAQELLALCITVDASAITRKIFLACSIIYQLCEIDRGN